MHKRSRFLSSLFLACRADFFCMAPLATPLPVYDPIYSDYHVWVNVEVGYYHQWARDNHGDEHRDFRSALENRRNIGPGGHSHPITTITRSRYVPSYRQARFGPARLLPSCSLILQDAWLPGSDPRFAS